MGNLISPIDSIPSNQSTSQEWLNWYDSLKGRYGAKNARIVWLEAWRKHGSTEANTSSFRKEMEGNGIDIDGDYGILSRASDAREDTIDFLTGGVKLFGSVYLIIMVVSFLLIGFILYKLAKNPESTAKIATLVATKGKM